MSENAYKSDDMLKTSTGVGSKWRFSSNSSLPAGQSRRLSGILNKPSEVTPTDHYQSTSALVHNYKCVAQSSEDRGPHFSKPPAHYKVHYNKDLHEKLQSEKLRRPLTTGHQLSETQEEFSIKHNQFESQTIKDFHGFSLKDHLKEPFHSSYEKINLPKATGCFNKSIYALNDPYMTTYQKGHRAYKAGEIDLGQKLIRDPLMVVPHETPMRDKSFFKSATKITKLPSVTNPVPNSGMKSEYREHFRIPLEAANRSGASTCSTDTKLIGTTLEPSSVFSVPNLYKTEYSTIGSKSRLKI